MDSNPLKEKYMLGVQKLFQTYNETNILFADYGNLYFILLKFILFTLIIIFNLLLFIFF